MLVCIHCWSRACTLLVSVVVRVYTAGQRGRTYAHARQQDTPTKQSADNHAMLTWNAKIYYEIDWKIDYEIDYKIDWKIDYKIDWKIAYRVEKSPIVLAAEKE